MKKIIIVLLTLPLMLVMLGCEQKDNDVIEIGILQYLEINALTEARKGFIDGLEKEGFIDGENINIKVLNPETDAAIMNLNSKELVRRSDLILAIATPAAASVINEAREQRKDTPILFTAVTDPVESKLIESNEFPGGNVTGTNDMNPIKDQISLIKELNPDAETMGIIYTASESNSEVQAAIAKKEAEKLGIEVIINTIQTVNDLQTVANSLTSKIDILYVPTDNVIAGAISAVSDIATRKNVPIIVGEENMVYNGGTVTYSVDYYRLGEMTAQMAVKILRDNVSPKDIPSTGLSEFRLVINKKLIDEMGIVLSDEFLNKSDEVIE